MVEELRGVVCAGIRCQSGEGVVPLSEGCPPLPPPPLFAHARAALERTLSARPALSGSALLGFTVYALVIAVLPDVWLTWDLPNPQAWTAAFLVLLLLHAERPALPRGAWFELWCAAAVLTAMHLALLVRSWGNPVLTFAPNTAELASWHVMWGCVLTLVALIVLASHRSRTRIWGAAAVLLAPTVPLLAGVLQLQDLEALLGGLLCLYTGALAVRRRREPESGATVPAALCLAALLFTVFALLNHPAAFRAYGTGATLATALIAWGCLGLLTAAVLVRARQVTLGAARRDR